MLKLQPESKPTTLYSELRAMGVCTHCHKAPAREGKSQCEICAKAVADRYKSRTDKPRRITISNGLYQELTGIAFIEVDYIQGITETKALEQVIRNLHADALEYRRLPNTNQRIH